MRYASPTSRRSTMIYFHLCLVAALVGVSHCRSRNIVCAVKTGPELNARALHTWRYMTSGFLLSCSKAVNRGPSRCHSGMLAFTKNKKNLAKACGSQTDRSPSNPVVLYKFAKADCTGRNGDYDSDPMTKICCIKATVDCKGATTSLTSSFICGSPGAYISAKEELENKAAGDCCKKRFPNLSGFALFMACVA